jgi:ABC-type lipoprotein export system ATPase subunit
MTDQRLLETDALRYDVATRTLWEDLSLALAPGESVAVRGVSGQGKSTLLRCLGGIQRPTRGVVRVLGRDVHRASARERRLLRRATIGFVTQDHAVVPEWSVERNLRAVARHGQTRHALAERIEEALHTVGLGERGRSRAGLLSGGEQQRVAVARVLVQRPRVLLADEPTASLDDIGAERVRDSLAMLRSNGGAVVVATHDPELVRWAGSELVLGESGARG